jgi:hypothetical protein
MTDRERLVEEAVSAWRPSASGALRPHPAWADLDAAGRLEVFELTRLQRRIESSLDAEGLSSTARAVLARIQRA